MIEQVLLGQTGVASISNLSSPDVELAGGSRPTEPQDGGDVNAITQNRNAHYLATYGRAAGLGGGKGLGGAQSPKGPSKGTTAPAGTTVCKNCQGKH